MGELTNGPADALYLNAETFVQRAPKSRDGSRLTDSIFPLLWKYREMIMAPTKAKKDSEQIVRYADMLAAMGTEPRLRIMQLLLKAHPEGMVVGEIGSELDIPSSTLSHHLEKLKHEDLVRVRREATFLWYSANN